MRVPPPRGIVFRKYLSQAQPASPRESCRGAALGLMRYGVSVWRTYSPHQPDGKYGYRNRPGFGLCPDLGLIVELPGIEPGSYGIPSRLLRAQFAMPLLGSLGHANQPR